jgi:hypothetical protein
MIDENDSNGWRKQYQWLLKMIVALDESGSDALQK